MGVRIEQLAEATGSNPRPPARQAGVLEQTNNVICRNEICKHLCWWDINSVTSHQFDLESRPFITRNSKAIRYPRRDVAHAGCRVDRLLFK